MKLPRVAVIVLNWNGLAEALDCLESLAGLDYPAYEVVVVDNGSTMGLCQLSANASRW
jgi:GT2 family glycosyltransferase